MAVAQLPSMVHTSALVLVENPKRDRYVCGIKQFTRQDNNRFHLVIFNKLLANGDGVFITKGTICQQKTSDAFVGFQFGEHVENPRIVGVALRRSSIIGPVHALLGDIFCKPMFEIERRISHDVVKNKSGMPVFIERGNGSIPQMVGYATHGQVHLGETESGLLFLLPENINSGNVTLLCLDIFSALDKHTAGPATWIVECAIKRFDKGGYKLHDVVWSVKLAIFFGGIYSE